MTAPPPGAIARFVCVLGADIDAGLASVTALVGETFPGPGAMRGDHDAVPRDPAGAAFAPWQKGT